MTFTNVYSDEVKDEAIALAALVGASEAARRYAVPPSTIWRWAKLQSVVLPRTAPVPRALPPPPAVVIIPIATAVRACPPHHWDVNDRFRWLCFKCAAVKDIPYALARLV